MCIRNYNRLKSITITTFWSSNTDGLLLFPAGLALLIAQGAAPKKDQSTEEEKMEESIKDLDSSGPDGSEPETNLWDCLSRDLKGVTRFAV